MNLLKLKLKQIKKYTNEQVNIILGYKDMIEVEK